MKTSNIVKCTNIETAQYYLYLVENHLDVISYYALGGLVRSLVFLMWFLSFNGIQKVTPLRFIDIVAVRCLHSRLKILLFLFSEASLTFR